MPAMVQDYATTSGTQYLDSGGLTFLNAEFLPWMCEVEESIKKKLKQKGYQKYGQVMPCTTQIY